MGVRPHFVVDFIVYLVSLGAIYMLRRWNSTQSSESVRLRISAGLALAAIWLTIGMALTPAVISKRIPNFWASWIHAGAVAIAAWVLAAALLALVWKSLPAFDPQRRKFLGVARAATFAAPVLATGFGIIQRDRLTLRQVDVRIPNLPKDLQGLRIVQISDIHLSPFVSEALLARAVDMANETRADIGLVTGDLITRAGDPLDTCLKQLARLKVDAPVLGCLGNHEIYAASQEYTTRAGSAIGIRFLRRQSQILRFGDARINFAGYDYQRKGSKYLDGAEELIVPGTLNVMLSHNPDVFPVAAAKGYDLTLSGHTHGGQVNVEILHQGLNIARFMTPYVDGLYQEGNASIFVTRGVGTVGIPARLGVPPEVALIRLCAT
jgi:predicted MPP superfamily phosphohydrolase